MVGQALSPGDRAWPDQSTPLQKLRENQTKPKSPKGIMKTTTKPWRKYKKTKKTKVSQRWWARPCLQETEPGLPSL